MHDVGLFIALPLMLIYAHWVRKQEFFRHRAGRIAVLIVGGVITYGSTYGIPWLWNTILFPKIVNHEQQAVKSLSDADLSRSLQQQSPQYREGSSGNPKLTALPQNEARADPTYFNFFYGVFVSFVGIAMWFFGLRWQRRLARRQMTKRRDSDGPATLR